MAAHDRISILGRKSHADRELARLMGHNERVRMSIPVDENYDTDRIIGASLDDIQYLLDENYMLLTRIAKLEQENAILENGRAILKGTIDKFVSGKSDT